MPFGVITIARRIVNFEQSSIVLQLYLVYAIYYCSFGFRTVLFNDRVPYVTWWHVMTYDHPFALKKFGWTYYIGNILKHFILYWRRIALIRLEHISRKFQDFNSYTVEIFKIKRNFNNFKKFLNIADHLGIAILLKTKIWWKSFLLNAEVLDNTGLYKRTFAPTLTNII